MDGFENIRRTVNFLEEPGESNTLKMSVDNNPNFADNDEDGDEVVKLKINAKTKKGRGFKLDGDGGNSDFENFEVIVSGNGDTGKSLDDKLAQRSHDGWIVFVTGVHAEAHEEDVLGPFSEYGEIKNLHLNLDRRTGFLKGYALIEFGSFNEAEAAKNALNGAEILGSRISVDWAFVQRSAKPSRRVVK